MRQASGIACWKSSNGCEERFAPNLGSTRWNTFLTSDFAVRANKPNCATRHGNSPGFTATGGSSRVVRRCNPSQASLRRAVSTACYALFHLLTEEAARRWSGASEARTGMERAFQHGPMKNISLQFRNKMWEDWHSNRKAIPSAIQEIAA